MGKAEVAVRRCPWHAVDRLVGPVDARPALAAAHQAAVAKVPGQDVVSYLTNTSLFSFNPFTII